MLTGALGSLPCRSATKLILVRVLVTSSVLRNLARMSGLATVKPLDSFWFLEFESVCISPYLSCDSIGHIMLLKPSLIGRIMPLKNLLLSTSLVNVRL